ncbi:hypothetical protein B0T24DRAFT_360757 [Lasiosphaeria ovina]|uniref:Uncharacterized protein n=1 Tax=Lasiosphaeria ovina TaxID=92902 RepID=A0AAE0N3I9_9PEZI|nr:hypothetical protein B0T24DRAFT_360757 [Lasiosphaeria ovina]
MLMEPGWAASNAMQLMMHCEGSWSGPGGWLAVTRQLLLLWRRRDRPTQWPSKLWMLLASLSALPYLALPLSGLCMELGDGFVDSDGPPAAVIGRNNSDFESRIDDAMIKQATERRTHSRGTAWGVVLRYNCSVVTRMADFSILSHGTGKRENTTRVPGTTDTYIMGRNQSLGGQVFNLEAYMELGSSSYEGLVRTWRWFQRYYDAGGTNYTPPAFDAATGTLEGDEVLEVALWQSIDPDPYGQSPASRIPDRSGVIPSLYHSRVGSKSTNASFSIYASENWSAATLVTDAVSASSLCTTA